MGVYSIKDLENFTQIKAHTLRVWEQRYNLLTPERTNTNIRLYSDRDLKKILNINLLYTNGLKISKIAQLREEEIFRMANELLLKPVENEIGSIVDWYISQIIRYDEIAIKRELDRICKEREFADVFSNLIIPILTKVGELWQVDAVTIAHEHFFSHILRDFIIKKTDKQKLPRKTKGLILLFLKENEYHELGLLFYNFLLREKGYRTIYLGQSVPIEDAEAIIRQMKPDYVFSSLIARLDEKDFENFFDRMINLVNNDKLYVGGYQMTVFKDLIPEGVNTVHSVDAIKI